MKTVKKTTTARSSRGRSALARAGRDKLAVLERLQSLGLVAGDEADQLVQKAEDLREARVSDGLTKSAAFDRALTRCLDGFTADAADVQPNKALHALVAWQEKVSGTPADVAGLTAALERLGRVIPMNGATLHVRDCDRQTVAPLVTVGQEVELISRIRFAEGRGFSSWVASRRQPVLYTSLHRNEAPAATNVRSFMCVPLVAGAECVGVLNVGHGTDGFYNAAWLRILSIAGAVLAGPVQRYVALAQIAAREIADPATELATETYLRARLDEEVVRCRELGHSMSLLVVRLRELEEHARRFGPEYGERCRLEFAEAVRQWAEPTESAGHWREGSLAVILPAARREKAEARAAALRGELEKHVFPRRKRMTAAVGLATYPGDAESAQELAQCADTILQEPASMDVDRGGSIHTVALS